MIVLKKNKRAFELFLALLALISTAPAYPIFGWFESLRDKAASRVAGDISDEELAFLEEQEDPMLQVQASMMKTTWADVLNYFIKMPVSDCLKENNATQAGYIASNTAFGTAYKWFARKLKPKEVVPALIKGALCSAVIFMINEVAKKTLYPERVKKNYYASSLVGKVTARVAVAAGVSLLGIVAGEEVEIS